MQQPKNWTATYQQLLAAERKHALPPDRLETLALAAYLTGKEQESFQFMERAHQGYLEQEKTEPAVRSAFWLGLMLMQTGKKAMFSGWMARGERLLNERPATADSVKGLFLIPRGLEAFAKGNPAKAGEFFEQAIGIGEHAGDANLTILGRLGQGQAFIHQEKISKGLKLLDEMMVTVQAEEVFPVVHGIVYCAVIEACRKVWDIKRAQEWTTALTSWCEAQPGLVPFKGQCLIHRSEIYQLYGDWIKAAEEINDACQWMTQTHEAPAAGEAFYRKAELHRLKGEFKEADEGYHEAAKRGRKPQPGLARLRLATGQPDVAETAIRNSLSETKDKRKRAELLPAVVAIMIAGKQPAEAQEAAQELLDIAREFDVSYLHAMAAFCQGIVFSQEGNLPAALEQLQQALHHWSALHLPYESACTREVKGRIYRELNDLDNSETEFEAAQWIFDQLQAVPDHKRVERLLKKKTNRNVHGLTLRELQVLNQVALGKTNRSVAEELFISERTVDRHVSNILGKLGVSSRVSAITFALKNNLMENLL